MEVYSAQKRARTGLTLAATVVLMVIAVLQSFSMVYQKQHRLRRILDQTVQLDDQLTLRIPAGWVPADDSGQLRWFRGLLRRQGGEFDLGVGRLATQDFASDDQAFDHALQDILRVPQPPMAVPSQRCEFAGYPAALRSFHLEVGGLPCPVAVVISRQPQQGTLVLALVGAGAPSAIVEGLARQVAEAAELSGAPGAGSTP